jgi:DNA polymerase-3 subunit alpha
MRSLIFDTETTELIANSLLPDLHQPRIVEFFGHVVEDDGTVLDELEFMCNPGVPIPEESAKITGIKSEDVQNLPPFKEFEGKVRSLIGGATAIVGHNLAFDWDVLNLELKRTGTLEMVRWPAIRICTVEETEWFKGFRLSLSGLHEHLFGSPFEGAHRAKNDVQALTRCFLELRKRGDI